MAKKEKTSFFANITADVAAEEPTRGRATPGYLADRDNTLSNLASGKYESRSLLWVDPAECRIWAYHNRRYDLLSETRCADLIEGMKSIGRQEFPAIVRPLSGDADFKYEVIAGARRHWTISWLRANNYPGFRFLVDVRAELTDEEAFRISDVENRDREDISDYERALDYKQALGRYYRTQKDMAERLEVSEAWLSRYLSVAEFPGPVVDAYADIRDIRVQHGRDLKVFLKSKAGRQSLIKEAERVHAEQRARQESGRTPLDGSAVVNRLKTSGAPKKKAASVKLNAIKGADGKLLLSGSFHPRSGWVLKIPASAAGSRAAVISAVNTALDETGG